LYQQRPRVKMNRKAADARSTAAAQRRQHAMTDNENSSDAGVTNATNEEPRRAVNCAASTLHLGRNAEEKKGR